MTRQFHRLLLVFLAIALTSVASSSADLGAITQRGTLRIGVAEFVPWTFKNRQGQFEGFEVDVGKQLARDMGLTVEFKSYPLTAVLDAVDRDEIDLIAAGLAITPARALRAEFSLPYTTSGATLVTRRNRTPRIANLTDVNRKGIVVVTVSESFSAAMAALLIREAEVKLVPNEQAVEKELLEGRAQAAFTSIPEGRYLVSRHRTELEMPSTEPIVGSVAGFAVKRGNQSLLNFLNSWIAAHMSDGLLPAMHEQWFNRFEWKGPAEKADQ